MSSSGGRRRERLAALALGVLLSLLVAEGFLRIYQPVGFRLQRGRLVLAKNQLITIDNQSWDRLDRHIIHTKNSLGFRGPEPAAFFDRNLTVLAVGGSTTECYYLSDHRAWPHQLGGLLQDHFPNIWVNNAGLDGHSTFGHLLLMESHVLPLAPKVVIFLVGINDVGLAGPREKDHRELTGAADAWSGPLGRLERHSALASFVANLGRVQRARQRGLVHPEQFDVRKLERVSMTAAQRRQLLEEHDVFRAGFEGRLRALVEMCREHGILPVLVTQPALFGDAVDPVSGVDLGEIAYRDWNGRAAWELLESYNDVTRRVASAAAVPLVDLARELAKDSRLFYDYLHFTNEGAQRVAEILERSLCVVLSSRVRPAARPCDAAP